MNYESLMESAKKASLNSYSPYSDYKVGAAVLTKNKNVYMGTNVENASYGLTICAERSALCNAVSSGEKEFTALAVYNEDKNISPCGACREFIKEFGLDIEIVYYLKGEVVIKKISELLPDAFTI